jgi:hypothetical protein
MAVHSPPGLTGDKASAISHLGPVTTLTLAAPVVIEELRLLAPPVKTVMVALPMFWNWALNPTALSPETVADTERTFTWEEDVYVKAAPVDRDSVDVDEEADVAEVAVVREVVSAVGGLREFT